MAWLFRSKYTCIFSVVPSLYLYGLCTYCNMLWIKVSAKCYVLSCKLYPGLNILAVPSIQPSNTSLLCQCLQLVYTADSLAEDVSHSSGSSWAPHQTPAGCIQFIQPPLSHMEYFTHLSKQINGVQTDVRGANRIATGQCIPPPDASLCVCVVCMSVCTSQARHADSCIGYWFQLGKGI